MTQEHQWESKISFWWKTPVLWCLILFAALSLRLAYWYLNPTPPRDAVLYGRLMEALHYHGTSSLHPLWQTINPHESFWIPPLSLYILKLPMYFGVTANSSGIIISMLAGMSLIPCILLIGRELFPNGRWYLWGAALAAVHPRLVESSTQNIRDGIFLAISGWLIYFILRLVNQKQNLLSAVMILLLWPAAFMIRYEGLEILLCFLLLGLTLKKQKMLKFTLFFFGGLTVSCLCFAFLSPIMKDYLFYQLPARMTLYCMKQHGGSFLYILFQKIPKGLFWPCFVTGTLGLFVLILKHWKNHKVRYVFGMILFMLIWRAVYRINSSRYVHNLIIPYLMLSVYFLFSLYHTRHFQQRGQWLSIFAGIFLLIAGTGKTLHYNPYADCMLKISSLLKTKPDNIQIFTNKERSRLSHLSGRKINSFTANTLTIPKKNKYLIIWYHPTRITAPADCRFRNKIQAGGCQKIFESFTNRKRKTTVTVYAGGEPQPPLARP